LVVDASGKVCEEIGEDQLSSSRQGVTRKRSEPELLEQDIVLTQKERIIPQDLDPQSYQVFTQVCLYIPTNELTIHDRIHSKAV